MTKKIEALLETARRYDELAARCDGMGNLAASIRATEGALQCREAARSLLVYGDDAAETPLQRPEASDGRRVDEEIFGTGERRQGDWMREISPCSFVDEGLRLAGLKKSGL
jgi:hypothetical protein